MVVSVAFDARAVVMVFRTEKRPVWIAAARALPARSAETVWSTVAKTATPVICLVEIAAMASRRAWFVATIVSSSMVKRASAAMVRWIEPTGKSVMTRTPLTVMGVTTAGCRVSDVVAPMSRA